jgi:hypothetical protein
MSTVIRFEEIQYIGAPPVGLAYSLAQSARLAVAANLDGHLEAFAVGKDGAVWHTWQTSPNASTWSQWASLGHLGGDGVVGPLPILADLNADGRLEIFVTDDEYNVWHTWQVVPNANWIGQWGSLGKPPVSDKVQTTKATTYIARLVRNEADALEVFLCSSDTGAVWCKSQTKPNGNFAATWTYLGFPPNLPYLPAISDFILDYGVTDLLELIAIGSQPWALWHTVRSGGPTSQWSAWQQIGQLPNGLIPASLFGAKNRDGRLELMCTTSQRDIWHTWQSAPSPYVWSGAFSDLGQPAVGLNVFYDINRDLSQRLFVVAWGSDNLLYSVQQSAPDNGWAGWFPLLPDQNVNALNAGSLVLKANKNGLLNAFGLGANGNIFCIPQVELKE